MHWVPARKLQIMIVKYMITEKEFAKGGQVKESVERQYSRITELEERYQHKMHTAKVCIAALFSTGLTPTGLSGEGY